MSLLLQWMENTQVHFPSIGLQEELRTYKTVELQVFKVNLIWQIKIYKTEEKKKKKHDD